MKFLRYKKEYFGEDKLGRDITLEDLTEEDKKVMLSGLVHIQAGRDRMGRVIVYWFHHLVGRYDPEPTVSTSNDGQLVIYPAILAWHHTHFFVGVTV